MQRDRFCRSLALRPRMRAERAKEEHMFVKRAWYAAGLSRELREKPLYRELLGEHVALFRDSGGKARAISALCPHRGANLGAGKVAGDTLQCPFHGWRFNGEG